jgi:hypothetical protein
VYSTSGSPRRLNVKVYAHIGRRDKTGILRVKRSRSVSVVAMRTRGDRGEATARGSVVSGEEGLPPSSRMILNGIPINLSDLVLMTLLHRDHL